MSNEQPNLRLWDRLSKTDPRHTKQFKRQGGFSGTAIKPMWAIKRATEEFGPIGEGWGFEEEEHVQVPCSDGQILIYIRAKVWYVPDDSDVQLWTGPQWGGDFAVKMVKQELRPDDEAFKKALTDAVMKCLAYLGIGADVHMGQFDDQKYVAEMQQHFSEPDEHNSDEAKVERMKEALQDERVSSAVKVIKDALANEDLHTAAVAWWDELTDDDKIALWVAPTKGGIFTTAERETIKSTAFREAYKANKTEAA